MKKYKNNTAYFDHKASILNNYENLWSEKLFLVYEKANSYLSIYDAKTLQLLTELPFPHFKGRDLRWGNEQSSFIVSNGEDEYCLIKCIS